MSSRSPWLRCLPVTAVLGVSAASAAETDAVLAPVRATETLGGEYRAERATSTTKSDTPLQDVPQSVSVVTRESIDDLNLQSLGDAMNYVPGVGMAQGEGNRETPVIRGNSSTGDFFLDGMRDDVQYYRDLYNIERVEVLKGPNGAIFGRGGVGGLINRVSKQADWTSAGRVSAQLGNFTNRRATLDVGGGVSSDVALRLNAMVEDSESYRDDVTLERYGVNPTLSWKAGSATLVTFGVEYFHDERTADRGVSSFQGRPLEVDSGAFFGDPAQSPTETTVKLASAMVEHRFSEALLLRNRTRYGDYDKFYQNVFPGATNAAGTTVSISAYNQATERRNLFNQTDLFLNASTGSVQHKILAGAEFGRQETDNLRLTGFFDSLGFGTTSFNVPLSNPRTTRPAIFRPNATDANNASTAKIAAAYFQDEIAFTPQWILTAGLRYDRFEVDLTNNRNGARFRSSDDLLSPRLGLTWKPAEQLSLYGSYGLAYQPRAGDQLASLSATNSALDPEEFRNYEVGAKWTAFENLAFTAAVFRLERTNVAITDPVDITRSLLVDGQQNDGFEFGLAGAITERWNVLGTYTYQDAEITTTQSATVQAGARLASLPKSTYSLWNRFDLAPAWGVGLGVIHRDDYFAATENILVPASNVKVPSFTRVDAAVYFTPNERWRAQVNVENLLDRDYYQFAHSNTNITPGSPFAIRGVLTYNF